MNFQLDKCLVKKTETLLNLLENPTLHRYLRMESGNTDASF